MTMKTEVLDELLKDCRTAEDIFGAGGLVKQIALQPYYLNLQLLF